MAGILFGIQLWPPPGHPPKIKAMIEWEADLARRRLAVAMREVRQSLIISTVRDSNDAIAEILLRAAQDNPQVAENLRKRNGKLPTRGYLGDRVADLVRFVEARLGPAPRDPQRRRDRAMNLIRG
jgi:hypothetical protein